MKALFRLVSRISVRLLAFNILLVFLPLAGVFYLGEYETRLQESLDRSLLSQADIVATVLSYRGPLDEDEVQDLLDQHSRKAESRIRVIDSDKLVVADSWEGGAPEPQLPSEARSNWLYRIGATIFRVPSAMFDSTDLLVQPADYYEASVRLTGPEVLAAFQGDYGKQERTTAGGARSVTVYRAAPIWNEGAVIGVVLASQPTQLILVDLYAVRLGIFRVFVLSVIVSALLSLVIAATIVRPLSRLRREAGHIVDRSGRLTGNFSGSKRLDEIGDLARALQALTQSLERHISFIESFSADVSHEFKNPLASIRTATEMLTMVEDDDDRERFVGVIQQEIARMGNLLSGIREVTLIDAELHGEERDVVAVGEVTGHVVDGFRMRVGDRLAIVFEPPTDDVTTVVSTDRLAQVVENLLDNAVSFSADGSEIEVSVVRDAESACVTVADRGPGIPDEHRDRIFDRFFSYRRNVSASDRHAGLGLSIVKSIVEGYGGTIEVHDREGGGSVFEVRLPGE